MDYVNLSLRHKNRFASARAANKIKTFFSGSSENDSEDHAFEVYEEAEIEETFRDERYFFDSDIDLNKKYRLLQPVVSRLQIGLKRKNNEKVPLKLSSNTYGSMQTTVRCVAATSLLPSKSIAGNISSPKELNLLLYCYFFYVFQLSQRKFYIRL